MAAKERRPLPTPPPDGHRDSPYRDRFSSGGTSVLAVAVRWRCWRVSALKCGVDIFDDPVPRLKLQLGRELARAISSSHVDDLMEALETDAPRISDLRRGKLTRFSLETLLRYAQRLNLGPRLTFERPAEPPR